jgi:hypothetical protein
MPVVSSEAQWRHDRARYDLGAIGGLVRRALHGIEEGLATAVRSLVHDMRAQRSTPPGPSPQSRRSPESPTRDHA